MSWWGQEWHKVCIGVLTLGKSIEWVAGAYNWLWEKVKPLEEFVEMQKIERRSHMNLAAIGTLASWFQKLVPFFDAAIAEINPLITTESADVQAAWAALVKCFSDFKAAIAAVKTAVANAAPKA